MSEPEEVILDGAQHAATAIAALWKRRSDARRPAELRLADVRPRLELLAGALFRGAPPIGVAEPPFVANWVARFARRTPRHLVVRRAAPWTDGAQVRLPASLSAPEGPEAAFRRYRIHAIGLTAAAERGSAAALRWAEDALVRDLCLVAEAAAVDAWLVREAPGLAADLAAERGRTLAARPDTEALTALERRVEALAINLLGAPPSAPPDHVPICGTPAESLAWARHTADAWREEAGTARARRYRGLPPFTAWGEVLPAPERTQAPRVTSAAAGLEPVPARRVHVLARRPRVRRAPDDEDDERVGMWMVQIDDPQESVEDPMGLQRPVDRDDDADPGGLADSLSELPEARLVPEPGSPREVLASEDPPPRGATAEPGRTARTGIAYPEWDYRQERYRPAHAIVREREAHAGDLAWALQALERHAREVEHVRRRFERLRARRVRLRARTEGPELDTDAYVTAHADRLAGGTLEDRLYQEVRPARRDVAILLLVDVSGSTDAWVADKLRIVDVEKEALLVLCEALDALGDPYAVLAFSGEGPGGVSVGRVKSFAEPNGERVRRRVAALEPDRFTRTGAALRHAAAALAARDAKHRLLLLLSDGKPNDVDLYEGRYGVEDTRQAVAEARLQGLHAFCVTVDRSAPVYLPRVFGPAGYAVLRHPAALPHILADVVRMLLSR